MADRADPGDGELPGGLAGGVWFGLVRGPMPGVEVLPIVVAGSRVTPLVDFVREMAVCRVDVSELVSELVATDWDNDYLRDRLWDVDEIYQGLGSDLGRLSVESLNLFVDEAVSLACRAGAERPAGDSADMDGLRSAWHAGAEGCGPWVCDRVVASWSTGSSSVEEGVLGGWSVHREGLLIVAEAVLNGIAAIALAALAVGDGHPLVCLTDRGPAVVAKQAAASGDIGDQGETAPF